MIKKIVFILKHLGIWILGTLVVGTLVQFALIPILPLELAVVIGFTLGYFWGLGYSIFMGIKYMQRFGV